MLWMAFFPDYIHAVEIGMCVVYYIGIQLQHIYVEWDGWKSRE
jgi:hypothetical protein